MSESRFLKTKLARREFLRIAGGGLAAITGSASIAGCGSGSSGGSGSSSVPDPGPGTVNRGITGTVNFGSVTPLGAGQMPAAGGTVTFGGAGSLNGLTITAQSAVFSGPQSISLSSAPIASHTFGPLVNPVSPLIIIDTGGVVPTTMVIIRIPVPTPSGQFLAAVAYESTTGALRPLTTIDIGVGYIDVATPILTQGMGPLQMFVISIPQANSRASRIASRGFSESTDSGFRPNQDGWQFVNNGSVVSPQGICSGMSWTAAWYFAERVQKQGAPRLYGVYDNTEDTTSHPTPTLDQDDALAIKIASVAQIQQPTFPDSAYKNSWIVIFTIRACMALTGNPAVLYVTNGTVYHAVIAYRYDGDAINGILYISDPNQPGYTRGVVRFINGTMQPFRFYDKSGTPGFIVDRFCPIGLSFSTHPDFPIWSQLNSDWTQLDNHTIGSTLPAFSYTMLYAETTTASLQDKFPLAKSITLNGTQLVLFKGSLFLRVWINYVETQGVTVDPATGAAVITVPKGVSNLGLGVYQKQSDGSISWIDFQRINVTSGTGNSVVLTLASPNVAIGQTDQATAVVKDKNGNIVPGSTFQFTSDNTGFASIDPVSGLITGVAAGTANITATETKSGISATAPVVVGFQPQMQTVNFDDKGNQGCGAGSGAGPSSLTNYSSQGVVFTSQRGSLSYCASSSADTPPNILGSGVAYSLSATYFTGDIGMTFTKPTDQISFVFLLGKTCRVDLYDAGGNLLTSVNGDSSNRLITITRSNKDVSRVVVTPTDNNPPVGGFLAIDTVKFMQY